MGVYLRKEFNLRYSCKACVGEVHRFIGKVIGKVKSEALGNKKPILTVL